MSTQSPEHGVIFFFFVFKKLVLNVADIEYSAGPEEPPKVTTASAGIVVMVVGYSYFQ